MKLKMCFLVGLCLSHLDALEIDRLEEERLTTQLRETLSFQNRIGGAGTGFMKAKKRPRPRSLEAVDSLMVFPPSFPDENSLVQSPSTPTLSGGIPKEQLALMALVAMKFFPCPVFKFSLVICLIC